MGTVTPLAKLRKCKSPPPTHTPKAGAAAAAIAFGAVIASPLVLAIAATAPHHPHSHTPMLSGTCHTGGVPLSSLACRVVPYLPPHVSVDDRHTQIVGIVGIKAAAIDSAPATHTSTKA